MRNALKYAALILGPIALIVSLVLVLGDDSPVPGSRQFVNVVTGDLMRLDKDEIIGIPMPDSEGRWALFPVDETDDGSLVISNRYRNGLQQRIERGYYEELKVDPSTYVVQQ
ncbi:MAG: hypothetical protein AAFX05_00890 [Planctomycetota bacterium]